MSNQEGGPGSGTGGEKTLQQIAVQKTAGTATFPIDLAQAKIAHVKPSNEALKVATAQGTAQQATATYRTISTGQPSQVRVVMPSATIMPQSISIPKLEGNTTTQGVRAQIAAIPSRTLSQTSITVTRPVSQTTYLPRAGATNIQAQRLVTPIRTPTPPTASLSGNFVRGTTVARNSTSPASTVISPTTATWIPGPGVNPMQLIRTINPPRQRLVSSSTGTAGVVTVGQASNLANSQVQQQQPQGQANIQTTTTQGAQQAFVATLSTVLPTRQQTATLVYTNVSSSQAQQYNPTGSSQPRYAVATAIGSGQRNVRPIQFNRTLAPSKIVLTPTLSTGATVASLQARTTSGSVNLSTGSLPTTRIIQLQQQQSGTGGQQLIGTSRIPNNLMLQPIIMSGGGKIGIRPPVTIPAKVQPSLTITQLGLGKLSTGQSGGTSHSAPSVQSATITPSPASVVVGSVSGSGTAQSTQQTQIVAQPSTAQQQTQQQQSQINASVSNAQPSITHLVNVNQSSGQLVAQNVNVASSTTVVPLAISSRAPNVLAGTITPIKAVSTAVSGVPPVAKVIPQQQQHTQHGHGIHISSQSGGNQQTSDAVTSAQHQSANVFIHSRAQNTASAATTNVIPNTYIQQPTSFYYESVPASSVTVSTGVLSFTTTTVTSTISTSQPVTSTSLASGLVSSAAYNPTSTYTVVPAANRTVGQVQIPVSSSAGQTQAINQIQAVPLRFSSQHIQEQNIVSSAQAPTSSQQQPSNQSHLSQHAQIITMPQPQHSQTGQVQQAHMLIPVQTSIKLSGTSVVAASPPRTTTSSAPLCTISSAFLRKRDSDGSPIRAAKNLAPTLLSMGPTQVSNLIVERTKERDRERERDRPPTPQSRPGSSSGSTTVSANSSPGIDQQISEEIKLMTPMNVRVMNESHFSPINDMYPNQQQNNVTQSNARPVPAQQHLPQPISNNNSNNGTLEPTPRKKPRRSIENPPPTQPQQQSLGQHYTNNQQTQSNVPNNQPATHPGQEQHINANEGHKQSNNASAITSSNKENAKPTEIIIKKPRTCNLLDGYKQNWKAANNHFQRYSDVKPREERPSTVMDLANQAHVVQKINGWKVYHLDAQMEDLCEIESQVFDKLSKMLKQLETHNHSADLDRVSDLIKGNMQRSKIIVDGVNEARSQIMKIFEHKPQVSDIIHRCASKRNFKKREKT